MTDRASGEPAPIAPNPDCIMPLFVIPFPSFDPVLVHLGPVAIRWYALAYIVGILAGWLYARHIIRTDR
jgi:phosphatidylglycerol:prolipoprotein diacylglycerol transferase